MELAQKIARFSEIVNRERFSFEHSDEQRSDWYEYVAGLSHHFRAYRLKSTWDEEFRNDLTEVESKLGCNLPDDIKHFYKRWGCVLFNTWDSECNMLSAYGMTDFSLSGGREKYGAGRACIHIMEIDGECYFALRTQDGGENWEVVFIDLSTEDVFSESTIVTDKSFYELLDRLDRTNGYPPVQSLPNAFTPNKAFADTYEELRELPVLKAAMENYKT